jgi:DNA-binding NtrC family response regulator
VRQAIQIFVDGRQVAAIAIGSGGITLGNDPGADISLPLAREACQIAFSPSGERLVFRTDAGVPPEIEGNPVEGGALLDGETIVVSPYTLKVRVKRSPTSRLGTDLARATIVFDAGRGTLSRTTGKLTVLEGPDAGKTASLTPSTISLGTDPSCDLVLTDPFVSGRHATLIVRKDGFFLRDDGSTNGTFVGDARVSEASLSAGGTFRAGQTDLKIEAAVDAETVESSNQTSFQGMIGKSEPMRRIFSLIEKAAPTVATVLLQGPTGSGKELAARAVHRKSDRASGPFVPVNCGAIPPELVESELFGHVRGAFSGAHQDRRGLFELADQGTLFLDEVSELPPMLQSKLLRVLEEGTFRKVGGEREVRVDVRVVAATNRGLSELVEQGRFRQDLFYRLAMIPIELPPLKERVEDIRLLAEHFLTAEAAALGLPEIPVLNEKAIAALEAHPWLGNVRELRNELRRALILLGNKKTLDVDSLALMPIGPTEELSSLGTLEEMEREAIRRALAINPTRKAAAEKLGIAGSTLYEKMKKYELD